MCGARRVWSLRVAVCCYVVFIVGWCLCVAVCYCVLLFGAYKLLSLIAVRWCVLWFVVRCCLSLCVACRVLSLLAVAWCWLVIRFVV